MTQKHHAKEVTIYKVTEISSAHKLDLPYESKCNQFHGHNYRIEVWVSGVLNENGMVVDFHQIKNQIMKLDHKNLNDFINIPTVENFALFLGKSLLEITTNNVYSLKIRIWETSSTSAEITLTRS